MVLGLDSLTLSIPHIVPIQVGSYSQPETAYTNPEGGVTFKIVSQDGNTSTTTTREKPKLEGGSPQLEGGNPQLEGGKPTNDERTYTPPTSKRYAVAIRERFFTTFQLRREFHRIGDHTAIRVGNEVAHEGDVTSDVCLLENGLIQYFSALKALYGFDCKEAKVFLVFPHMVTAMDKRATALTRVDGRWKLEVEFQMLAKWTQTATAEGFGEFIVGQVGANYYKNLFLKLRYNG